MTATALRRMMPAGTGEDASEGSWRDVYVDHFPRRKGPREGRFERGVGLDGYDRHEGTDVPTHPTLKGPTDAKPKADPFKGH